jgi:hypothetical protein
VFDRRFSLLNEVDLGHSAQIERCLLGARGRGGLPFDGAVDDAAHDAEPMLSAGAKHLVPPKGRGRAETAEEGEAELLPVLDGGFRIRNFGFSRVDHVFHILTFFLFFYGSMVAQGVGRVLGNPTNFLPGLFEGKTSRLVC